MSSEVNLDEVPISKDGVGLTEQGGVVTDDVINRDAGWEGDTWRVYEIIGEKTKIMNKLLSNSYLISKD